MCRFVRILRIPRLMLPLALAAALLAYGVADAGTLENRRRAVRSGIASGGDSETVMLKELRRTLDDAKKLREKKAESEREAAAGPAKAGAKDSESAPKPALARPGCMYSGSELIWEKVPGTCLKK